MKRIITLITVLCSCALISISVAAQTPESEAIEILTHDCLTDKDTTSVFISDSSDVNFETKTTTDGFCNAMNASGSSPYAIIPPDNRLMVDSDVYPYSAVVCLDYAVDYNNDGIMDDRRMASGFLASRNVVVTAAHCLYSPNGWVQDMRVHYNQSGQILNNKWCSCKTMIISNNYAANYDQNYDWGILILQDNIGDQTGWFSIGTTEGNLDGKLITVAGYPSDKKFFQYIATERLYGSDAYTCLHNADIIVGQSGGPIYDINHTVWAIQTCESEYGSFNLGNRITKQLFDLIISYC